MQTRSATFHSASLMNPVLRFVPVLGLSLVACGDNGITAPKCERCSEMRVLTDRPEYRPGSTISFTITNRTPSPMRYDWCSVELVNRRSGDVEFSARYLPARRCGVGAGTTEVVEHMVVLAPGESVRDAVSVSGAANQAQYRLHVWIVDENGVPEEGNPIPSNVFDVFPSAQAAISR